MPQTSSSASALLQTREFWTAFRTKLNQGPDCDHTFRLLGQTLEDLGKVNLLKDCKSVLKSHGGYCDCEAFLNAAESLVGSNTFSEWTDNWIEEDRN